MQGTVCNVVAATAPEKLLASVARSAARLCGAPLASVALPSRSGDDLEVMSVFGTAGLIVEKRLPLAHSLNGMVLASGQSFRSPDVHGDRRGVVREIASRNRVRGLLIAPLTTRERIVGTLAVARRTPWEFSRRDEAALEAFAHRITLSIESTCVDGSRARLERPHPQSIRLTQRERDVLGLLASDRTCREVASALGLSGHTVRHYLERLKLRLGKATLHGLLAFVFERRLLD